MTRRRKRHALLCLLVLTTAPGFGLLCRGHSPSRFTLVNLPVWERTPPRPAPVCVPLRSSPLLLDSLPAGGPSAAAAGGPGLWLLAACPQTRPSVALRAQRDAVALRLMEAQHDDGSLASATDVGRWSRAQTDAHGQNLRGLLAYYAVSHNPAAVYAAIKAGDLILCRFPDVRTDAGCTERLVSPMTLLYLATGGGQYRRWAAHRARVGQTDGAGLCALYVATGEKHYLRSAQRTWRQECSRHRTEQDLTTMLWTLTRSPGYAKALHPASIPIHYSATGRPRAAT